ncbi:uncharacterized protein BDZ99DRAFT_475641 [Mytilinidion resinicola]|uniref:Ankyrin n=1 Tax=Mytilinidion resinicola TaxID=574789 RepID=A0A6A6YPE7_9PEZI|nr:uncharacterized protein BDZ99DRAFT_475641 [Mytilinidion resinicola]KAF2810752.1 hypothetical protein BDZ99DRAFT_475641 [Mytilinidion resinicola]
MPPNFLGSLPAELTLEIAKYLERDERHVTEHEIKAARLAEVLAVLLKHIEGKPKTWSGHEKLMNELTYIFVFVSIGSDNGSSIFELPMHQVLRVTELLFGNGGDVNSMMENEHTGSAFLDLVVGSWKPKILSLCFTYGADPLNESNGRTLLHRCIKSSVEY